MKSLRQNPGLIVLFLLFSASLALNVALGWRLKASAGPAAPSPGGVQKESVLPEMAVRDVNGGAVTVTFDASRPTILYVLSPACSWCDRNHANIAALSSSPKTAQYRFVGLSTTGKGLADYVKTKGLPFPVFHVDSEELITTLGLYATPQTVLVEKGGRVERVWVGAWDKKQQAEIESFFGVMVPGMQAP